MYKDLGYQFSEFNTKNFHLAESLKFLRFLEGKIAYLSV